VPEEHVLDDVEVVAEGEVLVDGRQAQLVGVARGSTTRTWAPDGTADWASVSWVVSLPCAFWMLYCEGARPAALNARARYGASNSV
jgi:hypothetical protein